MLMHAARFLDLSCCRLNANGTFFDFDSKKTSGPVKRHLIISCPLPVLAATNWLLLHIAWPHTHPNIAPKGELNLFRVSVMCISRSLESDVG